MKLGVIGGMGPMASELFYKMVTEHTKATCDQEHVEMVILSDTKMPDRTAAILNHDYEICLEKLREDAHDLESLGCDAIAVTCNTAHFFVDMIKDEIKIPFMHMINQAACEMANKYHGEKIGIMATDGTIKTELYQTALKRNGLVPFTPSPDIQKLVMHEIYDCIKANKPCDKDAFRLIQKEFENANCKAVLMACTELSVIKRDENLDDWFVDPMMIMAKNSIEFLGKEFI